MQIIIAKSTQRLIKKEITKYLDWLIKHYNFPLEIKIIVYNHEYIRSVMTAIQVDASFFAPFDQKETGVLRVNVGDYGNILKDNSFKDIINVLLARISRQIQYYYQWVDNSEFNEEIAEYGGRELLREYLESTE
ncbi:hypothetical protein CIC46_15170 [Listeria monocytogenes]|nr:hypothetical protein [Listeria monocytogenes]